MRLTHVSHLRLPFGPLLSYETAAVPTGRELPLSFDQRRHAEIGDRAGSWMALSLRLPAPLDPERLARAWSAVIARHGTLRTVLSPGTDGVRLEEAEIADGRWTEHEVGAGEAMEDALQRLLDASCRPFSRPSHRLCLIGSATEPTAVIGSDHAHLDMWSLLVIARDLLAELDGTAAELPPAPPAFAQHTRALAEREPAPEEVRRRWREILAAGGDAMPRFPFPLGGDGMRPERVEVRDVLDVAGTEAYTARARAEGVSPLALTISLMTRVVRDLADAPLRVVFPVHSRYDPMWHDSVGWFITNSVLEADDPSPRAAAAAVKEAIALGSWPLADVLEPWGGMPETPGMFALSWLDLRRLPVQIDDIGLRARFVSAAIPTDGVMLWFVLDGAGVHLRCRYPDTTEARDGAGRWLDALVLGMRDAAAQDTRSR
ncbi:condensation domain-containing protein [Brachybacterium sp. DNPG3]